MKNSRYMCMGCMMHIQGVPKNVTHLKCMFFRIHASDHVQFRLTLKRKAGKFVWRKTNIGTSWNS